jgi:nucleotide-binding universal stress UspA family protein
MHRPALWDEYGTSSHPAAANRRSADSRTVVVGYDGSQAARRALVRAAEAAGAGGRVEVVTAVPPPDSLAHAHETDSLFGDPEPLIEEASTLLRARGINVSTRVDQADPAEALAATASETDARLIVVGARGDSYLARALRGSVGEKLVARAPCDVLIVR